MALEQLEDQGETARPGGARFVVAGVVGALALGVGLGLWARPADGEREGLAKPAAAAKPAGASGRLQIVVDDTPAPIGAPLEVLPAGVAAAAASQPQTAAPQPEPAMPMAPRRAPAGLMKVDAPMPPALAAIGPAPAPEPEPQRTEKPKAAKAKDAPKPQAARKAEKKKAEAPARKSEPKRDEAVSKKKSKPEPAKKQAKAGKTPPKAKARPEDRAEKADKRAEPTKKKAEPKLAKANKAQAAEKAPSRLSKIVGAVKSAPKKLKAETKTAKAKAPAKVAKAEPKKKVVKPKPAAKPKPALADDGSTRIARNGACALSDPGEALVCADPRLNQRDRQLQRAYRDAEAAGVPASALRRQQERWRQTRAAAARDGSWAVEDVYEARIAELNDLARDAREY